MKTLNDILKLMEKKSKTNDFKNCKTIDFTRDHPTDDIIILNKKTN